MTGEFQHYLGKKLSPAKKPRRFIKHQGRRGREAAAGQMAARTFYFSTWGIRENDSFKAWCPMCLQILWFKGSHPHHKLKRSARGFEGFHNMLCIHDQCHDWLHQRGHPERLKFILEDPANVANGLNVNWESAWHLKLELEAWLTRFTSTPNEGR